MGTWGLGPFDDDTAMDFVDGLLERPPADVPALLERAVYRVVDTAGDLDYAEAVEGVVAAALLAGSSMPPDVATWRSTLPVDVAAELAAAALRAVERAHSEGSVLWELWCESGRYPQVWEALRDTVAALRSVAWPGQETLF